MRLTIVSGIVTWDAPVSYWYNLVPRVLFSRPTSKAREKRPGDEVAIGIFPLSQVKVPEPFAKVNSAQIPFHLLQNSCFSPRKKNLSKFDIESRFLSVNSL